MNECRNVVVHQFSFLQLNAEKNEACQNEIFDV